MKSIRTWQERAKKQDRDLAHRGGVVTTPVKVEPEELEVSLLWQKGRMERDLHISF